MAASYTPLPQRLLGNPVGYFWPEQSLPDQVKLSSPAVLCFTDFKQVPPFTIEPNVSIDWALNRMKDDGVRLLLVVNTQRDLIGLITTNDILGEKPLKLASEASLSHSEILVRDIMTPYEQLDVIDMQDVLKASVGNVLETLKRNGRQHALVVDMTDADQLAVRGLFSATQLSRQLGITVEPFEIARTFAELETALNH